ncbi:hypothetical protein [Streptomyces chartreusis]|uniref:hypothetical protein n=1 Tax=Streptomyces chartreusis TaxID=1969 RepID=UPI003644079F
MTLNCTNRWNLLGAFVRGGVVTAFEPPATTAEICPAPGTPGSAAAGTEFWGFWCAIGLVAGFNERWAFGILSRDSTRRSSKNS